MKTFKSNNKISIFLLVMFVFLSNNLHAQVIGSNLFRMVNTKTDVLKSDKTQKDLLPINLEQRITGLSVSGNIVFTGKKGFVRIILKDIYENEYLVLETNTVFEDRDTLSFNEVCEETALLKDVLPKFIVIECIDATVVINEIQYSSNSDSDYSEEKLRAEQLSVKIDKINAVLKKKHLTWGAGKTSLSEMSYMKKKSLFGNKMPNLAGFDYYVSGIFVMQGYASSFQQPALKSSQVQNNTTFVSEFDWRNRHGRNWMTPAKNQGSCGSCWAFAPVGATEAYANLYYNQLLNLNLSEQDVLSCSGGGNCPNGGYISTAFSYIKNTGVVPETCFGYTASDLPCSNKCQNPSERIKIGNYISFSPSIKTEDNLKELIIKTPMTFGINCWWHFLGLVGFKTIQIGDQIYIKTATESRWETIAAGSLLIGANAWILKNSHGTGWGTNGFGYVVTNWSEVYGVYSIDGNITSLNYTNADIVCEDRDGDGYYFWGIGTKPTTCPACVPDEPDGDDSNPNLGPMDEYGNCEEITPLVENITTSQIWSTDRTICRNVAVQSGVTLTITATATVLSNYTITIQNGGKIILSGGTIDDGNIVAQNGSELTISNNGKILLGNYDNLDIQLGAEFNQTYGEVSLK